MSSQEQSDAEDTERPKKASKFSIQTLKSLKEMEETEVFNYIESLHNILKKNKKKLKKYKEKIKKLVRKVERLEDTQKGQQQESAKEDANNEGQPENVGTSDSNKENASKTLVDEIRQAAEQAQNLNGFVYEPTSGLYYDQKTGYYYNAEYGLYYDGNTGCYYKYNQEKNEFEFHSQVAATDTAAAAAPKTTTTKNSNDDIFDNYTIIAHHDGGGDEEWGVITEGQLRKLNKKKKRMLSENETPKRKRKRQHKHKHRQQTQHQQQKPQSRAKQQHKHNTVISQTDSSDNETDFGRQCVIQSDRKNNKTETKDMEDGEIEASNSDVSDDNERSHSDSSCCSSMMTDNEETAVEVFSRGSHFQDIAKKYPPSLRIIILESQVDELKVGSLSLITFKGGTLGREGKHDVIIPDVNVSKFHLKFIYDTKGYIYKCIDLGSRNGTLLNGVRMSISKVESDPFDLVHGSVLQIGQTKLLCHVHEGNSTCGQCEPGLLIEVSHGGGGGGGGGKDSTASSRSVAVALTHKEQLKKLQKKYGLENEKFVDNKQHASSNNYNDRAATRRNKVGSSTDMEKTQTASVNTAISSENKGFKMLSKLGWSKGEALGKTSTGSGLLEPLHVSCNAGKKGLGCEEDINKAPILTLADKTKLANLKKTRERYQKADIFHDSSDDSK